MKLIIFHIFFKIISIFCFINQIFSMQNDQLRNRFHHATHGRKYKLEEVVVGNFEDRQLAGENNLFNIIPEKVFPKEIWFEIISYLDFKDPALVYFFAPRIGITKKQAEKMAFLIHNFVIKNADKFEQIDLRLKSILKTYNKKTQELISNYITLLDQNFDLEYKNLSGSIGLFPIRWLLSGPSNVQADICKLKRQYLDVAGSYFEFDSSNSSSFTTLRVKDTIDDIDSLKKVYSKLKKNVLMYQYFGCKKYEKVLQKYREKFTRTSLIVSMTPMLIIIVSRIMSEEQHISKFFFTVAWMVFAMYHAWLVVLDKKSLSDQVVELEKIIFGAEKFLNLLNQRLNSKKHELKNAKD